MNKQEMMRDTHVVDQFMFDKTQQRVCSPNIYVKQNIRCSVVPYMHQYSAISPLAKARGTITVDLAHFQGLPANCNYFTSVTASHSLIVYLHKSTKVA